MIKTRQFHELNINMPISEEVDNQVKQTMVKVMPIEKYFGEMDLSSEQKKDRIKMARKLENELITIFSIIAVGREYGVPVDTEYLATSLEVAFNNSFDTGMIDDELRRYFKIKSWDIANSTARHENDRYYTSEDRATLLAEDEVSTVYNYDDFQTAIALGKTHKRWKIVLDKHTRDWHRDMRNKTIPIDDYFEVDGELMLYPHDLNASPSNTANCRCSIEYV